MHPQLKSPVMTHKRLLYFFLISLASIILLKGLMTPSAAQSSEERELENTVPKHLPIKVKIKKEKEEAFKDLNNEKWLRDLELEVTNTGDKPIYFLDFLLILPGITAPTGLEIAFPFHYGRYQLGSIETKAEPDDVPIKPGETYVLKAYKSNVLGWETFRRNKNKPQPKKLILHFRILSFGDGTGFWGNDGVPSPKPPETKSRLGSCEIEKNKNTPATLEERRTALEGSQETLERDILPVSFLPANFLSSDLSKNLFAKLNPQSQQCCSGNNCFRSKLYVEASCEDCPPVNKLMGVFCSDPTGACRKPIDRTSVCTVEETGFEFYCPDTDYISCDETEPAPTPFPTPTPVPTPTPTPTPCPLVCSEPDPAIPADPCSTRSLTEPACLP